jgi:hypothetical protein
MGPPIMTVGELIEHLSKYPSDTGVMIECEDHYYSGAMTEPPEIGEMKLFGPSVEKDVPPPRKPQTYPACWRIDDYSIFGEDNILERRPCVVIRTPS